jgi:hypothetical protein
MERKKMPDEIVIEQDTAQELASSTVGKSYEGWKVIENEIADHDRWTIQYTLVVQNLETEEFYRTCYSIGATESQDESPFEYDTEGATLLRVYPIKVEVTQYLRKAGDKS